MAMASSPATTAAIRWCSAVAYLVTQGHLSEASMRVGFGVVREIARLRSSLPVLWPAVSEVVMTTELNARYDPMTRDELIAECERLRADLALLKIACHIEASKAVTAIANDALDAAARCADEPSENPAIVEQQLAEDALYFGSAFYRLVDGRKVRIPPHEIYIELPNGKKLGCQLHYPDERGWCPNCGGPPLNRTEKP